MVSPDRILRMRDVSAMAALDTMPHVATRIRNLLAYNRRITITQRFTYTNQPPEVTAGLTVDDIREHTDDQHAGIGVNLQPGVLTGFGIHAYAGENDTEAGEWKRYHAAEAISDDWFKRRREMIRVDITGGMPGDGPARDDKLIVRAWNKDGVCNETVIAFDCGPRGARDRLARRLYIRGHAPEDTAAKRWDRGEVPADRVAEFERAADELLAVITGEEVRRR